MRLATGRVKVPSVSLLQQVLLHATSSELRAKFKVGSTAREQLEGCLSLLKGAPDVDKRGAEAGLDVPFVEIFKRLATAARDMYFTADPATHSNAVHDMTEPAQDLLDLCDTSHAGVSIGDDDDDASSTLGTALEPDDMCALRLTSFLQGVHSSQTGFDADLGDPREQ